MSRFKVGDVVRAGGPPMTVAGFDEAAGGVLCQWFVGAELHEQTFPEADLTPSSASARSGPAPSPSAP